MRTLNRSDSAWEKLAASDPYYGVLTADRYRSSQLNDESTAEFFLTGEEHIAHTIATAEHHLGCRVENELALDFGCGVGRLVIPMARRFADVVGVDVSPTYRSLAHENCDKRGLSNIRLVSSVHAMRAEVGTFDFVNSHLVFLHIPFRRGIRIIRDLVDLLRPGGVGAFHLLHHRDIGTGRRVINVAHKYCPPLHWALNAAAGRPTFEPIMQANEYSVDRVLRSLTEIGVQAVYIESRMVDAGRHAFLYFRKPPR